MGEKQLTFVVKGTEENIEKLEEQVQMLQSYLGAPNQGIAIVHAVEMASQILSAIFTTKRQLALVKKPRNKDIVIVDDFEILLNLVKIAKERNMQGTKKSRRPPK